MAWGAPHPWLTISQDTVIAVALIIPAIERSNTPARSGTTRPTATIAGTANWMLRTDLCVVQFSQRSGIQSEKRMKPAT